MYVQMQKYWSDGEITKAQNIQDRLVDLNQVLFCESNPMPVKYAASQIGLCSGELRLPLVEVSDVSKIRIMEVLKELKLI